VGSRVTDSPCPGCGLTLPATAGPRHPYMTASPECWSSYSLLLAAQYSDPERMAFHQLVVDAYAVQHPGSPDPEPDPRAVQSVGIHLMTLCLFLEFGADPALGPRLHSAMAARPVFTYLPAPSSLCDRTHADVPRDGDADVARVAANEWAQSSWSLWSDYHPVVRGWLATAELLPRRR